MSESDAPLICDVLIIGCGIGGATAALELAHNRELNIVVVTKNDDLLESNTLYAQGGIIYKGARDSAKSLAQDLVRAGDGLNNPLAVQILSEEGPRLVGELLIGRYKVPFTLTPENKLEVIREAAHSTSRILHADDATGRAIQETLVAELKAQSNITLLTSHYAIDLLTPSHHSLDRLDIYKPVWCVGAYVYDARTNQVKTILSKATILATGGLGQIFLNTTNPAGASGDGLAMAYRAGARIINAEYVQFHPTAFYHRGRAMFLISEALRGEGALLLNAAGERFMPRYEPEWKELAPRDVVARSIHLEMLRTGSAFVYLDLASVLKADVITERFPNIRQACLRYGVDPAHEPIPVVPAAHYFCGGVWVDDWGRTSIKRLYAVGEVTCTGVHGANRLGSASMLEGLVWGYRAAQEISTRLEGWEHIPAQHIPPWDGSDATEEPDQALIEHDLTTIKHTMWFYVGLVRSRRRLERAMRDLTTLLQDIDAFYHTTRLEPGILNLRNSATAATIVARAAWENRESHGCHYRVN
ncbi:MAG: L-aspartate oxidase [Chloroflexi bacterium]|nr:L-aspartate oxidase [Chloroflexota bacterium]